MNPFTRSTALFRQVRVENQGSNTISSIKKKVNFYSTTKYELHLSFFGRYVDKCSILPLGCFILTLSFVMFTLIFLFSTILLFRITSSFNFAIFLVIIIRSPYTGITFSASAVLRGTEFPLGSTSFDFFALSFFPENAFLRSDKISPPPLPHWFAININLLICYRNSDYLSLCNPSLFYDGITCD